MVINTSKSHYRQCNASVNTRFSISIADAVLERRNKSRLLVFTINVTLYQGIIVCLIYVIEIRSDVAISTAMSILFQQKGSYQWFYYHFLFCYFIYHGKHDRISFRIWASCKILWRHQQKKKSFCVS